LPDLEHAKAGGVEQPELSRLKMGLRVVSRGEKRGGCVEVFTPQAEIPRKQIPILVLGEAHISRSEQYCARDRAAPYQYGTAAN
jgi:hypothetical protein